MTSTSNNKLLVLLAQVVLITAGVAACDGSQNVGTLISEANAYQKKGEPKAAIIQLKNALQKNPDNAEARSLLGTIYSETGDAGSAEKEIRKALALGANPVDLLPTLGKVLLLERQFQKVLDEVKQPAGATPDPRYLTLRGNAYLGLGNVTEARKSFDLALNAKPDFVDALIGSAKLSLADQDVNAAAQFIERATTSAPTNVDAWLFKGDLLHAQGKVDEALSAYDKAAALKPDNISAHIAIAHLQIDAGKFDAAKAELDAARKRNPQSPLVAYTQALLDFKQGKYAAAQESVQQVLRVAPDHMPSVLLAGAIQYGLGSMQQAEQYLKKYIENAPANSYASRLLVATLLKNGETARAIKTLTPMLKDGEKDAQLLSLAGEAYMKAGDYSKATEYFEKASVLAPDTANIRTALGISRLAKGDNARGIAELELATSLNPQVSQSGILLVMTHTRLKEFDKALATVAKLEKLQPDNPLLQNLKGGIYLAMNNAVAARASFQKALVMQPSYFPAIANLAQMDMRDNKPDAAQKRLETFLQTDQKNVQAMTALAGIALSQNRKADATAWLERANNVKPDDLKPALLLAAHYLQIAEAQKAYALAQKLQTGNPDNPEVLDLLAQTQLANNDRASALQSYKKLIAASPNSALARFRIAGVYTMLGDQDAATEALKTSLSLDPDYLDASVALATMEVRKGNHEQALNIARQIESQARNKVAGYVLEGDILMSQKKPDLARKAYEQAMAINKSGFIVIKLHESLVRAGKEKEGETRLLQWLKEHPADTSTRMYLATAYFTSQQNRQAIEQYQTVLQAEPKNAGALNNLALAYQKEKDPRALQFAEKAYANAPESAAVLDTLGWLLIDQGNTARGLPLLQKSASLAPGEPDIHYHFAQGLLKSGEKAKARAELERLLASSKSFSKADEAQTLLRQLQ
jgi:putative PEP-CTERM system TPR-repeat lipoprotein